MTSYQEHDPKKIDEMVDDWVENAAIQDLRDYAASQLIHYYQSVSVEKLNGYYAEFLAERAGREA